MMNRYLSLQSLKATGWMTPYGACVRWMDMKKKYACTQSGALDKYSIL
jgi:hypothetical protein